jgi:hypothetical protein
MAVQVLDWDAFNVFEVATLAHGRPLEMVTLAVLQHFDLVDTLQLPKKKLCSFLRVKVCQSSGPADYHTLF